MENSFFQRLSSLLWGLIVTLIVLLAVYVSLGRMLTSVAGDYQDEILQELNRLVPFQIDAERVVGEWHSFTPAVVLRGLRLSFPGISEQFIELSEGRIGLDVMRSLQTWTPQMTRLSLQGLKLSGELTGGGRLRVRGFGDRDDQLGEWLENFLLNIERVTLDDVVLELALPGGEQRQFAMDLQLSRDGSHRRVEANLLSNRGTKIFVLAEGVGNPYTPDLFNGDLYLNIESADLGAAKDLLVDSSPPVWFEGAARLELWSSWEGGEPSADVRFESRDLLVAAADRAWQFPLDRVAFDARLVERRNHWGLFISDLAVARHDVNLQVPRLQLDAWGQTLRVRATEVPLAPLATLLADMEAAQSLAEAVQILKPRGILSALQLGVTDTAAPLEDWEVLANFDQITIDPWAGAPGIEAASGYLELAPGGGLVVLDSQQLGMNFPKVYRQAMHYDDFNGTIKLDWDKAALRLSSGLVSATGEEGEARALFAMTVPLIGPKTGIQMELLVGLENSHPRHRAKYIPYVLDEKLIEWLAASIGEGVVEQGGFLWRGSLMRGAANQRTVQLFFNIQDTQLSYHTSWPAISDLSGILLIDDTNVSVWSESARVLATRVDRLSVEVWKDQAAQLMLAVDGSMEGPAADGLAVVNQSALRNFVGDAFVDWQLSGQLATELNLAMNLTDNSVAPQVMVSTGWLDVDMNILPGNLPVRSLSGTLDFRSAEGFSSHDLQGKLWGRQLGINVGQQYRETLPDEAALPSAVQVDIATMVDMRDVRQWLDLESLAFASGRTEVDARLLVAPGKTPLLTLDSSLDGITLDLPAPWGKPLPDEHRQLQLVLPLGQESLRLGAQLQGGLNLELDVRSGTLSAGTLAFNEEPAELEPGKLRLHGNTPLVNVDEWGRFISEYFIGEGDVGAGRPSDSVAGAQAPPLEIRLDELHTDRLVVAGNDLGEVRFELAIVDGQWRIAAQSDWLRGDLHLLAEGGPSKANISYLDLAGLMALELSTDDSRGPIELPDLAVTLGGLHYGERVLGDLAFDLRSEGAVLVAQDVSGEVVGLRLRPEEPGQLRWDQGPDSRTEFNGVLHFQDLGESLTGLGYQRIVETREGHFGLALNWPGGPQDFSLLEGQGSLQVNVGEGRFLDAPSGASGTLRVVSILNLAEIVRRLSLSHMYESGIPFDQVEGEVFLHAGTIEVVTIDVQGGSSSFQFSGVSEVETETLNGELAVTLPLANNLPWVAALTAGLPVAAGVFLLSKVFEKQVNRITSAVYNTTGTWDDPQIKFDRIFDDSSQGSRALATQAQSSSMVRDPPATVPAGQP